MALDAFDVRNKDVTALDYLTRIFRHRASHTYIFYETMFSSASRTALRSITQRAPVQLRTRTLSIANQVTLFHTSGKMESKKVEEYKSAGNRQDAPPKHEAVYFKGLMSEKRSFGDFRTVLHTGLYSQLVAMEVPVGGEIGDEVRYPLCTYSLQLSPHIIHTHVTLQHYYHDHTTNVLTVP